MGYSLINIYVYHRPYIENEEGLPQDVEAVHQFNSLQDTVRSIRTARAEYGVEPGKKIPATVHVANAELRAAFSTEAATLALLARLDLGQLSIEPPLLAPPSIRAVHVVIGDGLEAYLPLAEMIDFDKEKKRLEKQVIERNSKWKGFLLLLHNIYYVGCTMSLLVTLEFFMRFYYAGWQGTRANFNP